MVALYVLYVFLGVLALAIVAVSTPYLARVHVGRMVREGELTVEEAKKILYGKKQPFLVDMSIDLGEDL